MITWLEDPTKYPYLRKRRYIGGGRFPVRGIGKMLGQFDRLIGYERTGCSGPYCFNYDMYWLKVHDRHAQPNGVYAGPATFGGHMPSEAVDPRTLVTECDICVREMCKWKNDPELVKYGCTEQITESEK